MTGEKPSWADMHAMRDSWFLFRFAPTEAEIVGTLAGTTVSSFTIRREDLRVGEVAVHFPKIGYSVTPA